MQQQGLLRAAAMVHFVFTKNVSCNGKMLTIKAYSSNLESKLLIAVAKI